jgi:hypothetical protein
MLSENPENSNWGRVSVLVKPVAVTNHQSHVQMQPPANLYISHRSLRSDDPDEPATIICAVLHAAAISSMRSGTQRFRDDKESPTRLNSDSENCIRALCGDLNPQRHSAPSQLPRGRPQRDFPPRNSLTHRNRETHWRGEILWRRNG